MIAPVGSDETTPAGENGDDRQRAARLVTGAIMAGVAVWGTVHAVGSYGYNHSLLRPLVVLACTYGFLGCWWLALRSSRARAKRARR